MNPITQLTDKAIAVILPEGAKDPWMLERSDPQLAYYLPNKSFGEEGNMWSESIKLPEGQWEILGRPSSITEDQWKGIVEFWYFGWKDYGAEKGRYRGFDIATESGLSLLKSKGLNPDVLILINDKQ